MGTRLGDSQKAVKLKTRAFETDKTFDVERRLTSTKKSSLVAQVASIEHTLS